MDIKEREITPRWRRRLRLGRLLGATAALTLAQSGPALAAGPLITPDAILSLTTFGAIAMALGFGLMAYNERRQRNEEVHELEQNAAALRARLARAERLLHADPGGIFIWSHPAAEPDKRGAGRRLLSSVLAGAQGLDLAAALEQLKVHGEPFGLDLRGDDGLAYRAEGRPVGSGVALWLRSAPEIGSLAKEAPPPAPVLAASEAESVLDSLPFPVWRRDRDLALTWVNRAYAIAAGVSSPGEAVARQAVLDRRELQLAKSALSRRETVFDKRYVIVGGQRRALTLTLTAHAGGVAGAALDVTAQDELEQRLQRHIDAHDDTLDKLKTAVAVFNADQKLAYYNRAYAKLWGLDPSWLDAHPSDGEILEKLRAMRKLPEQRDFPAWKRERLALYRSPPEGMDEFWHLPGDTTIRVMCQPHPLGGLLFLYDDVTNELTLERNYNTLITVQKETLDSLSEGVAVFGADGRLTLSNAAFGRIWNLPPDLLSGPVHFQELASHCRPMVREEEDWARLASSVTGFSTERRREIARIERVDGTELAAAVMPLPDGATMLSFADVTDAVRAEHNLRERNQALEASDRLKTEFVGHVSYQLRTPLASMIGFAEMLQQNFAGPLNAKQTEYLANILEAATQLRSLVNDILDLAVIDAGAMQLDLHETAVKDIVASVMPMVEDRAATAGVAIALEIDPDAGLILADARRIKQIVFNLVTNALNFTPPGGQVTISARAAETGVQIAVTDTGAGIPPEYQPRAFERFESRTQSGKRGAGLGLALVRSFVELHGGWVSLSSQPGKGTRVTCRFPRRPEMRREAGE
ncbi:MAG: PAS-domain containing protein [Alphaproteobacteria bacterium]|nr:PAS-domain containing protein [Alphaproteobacteria bacterium]